ncbi:hypothetical protein KSS87_019452 [Heliosperma pusillum]|nr:hypothetical protein KSS87_019452 [Heliosperma pusillum]
MLDSCSDLSENSYFDALEEVDDCNSVSCSSKFDVWIDNPESVETRRSKFFKWLGLDVDEISGYDSEESSDCDREIKEVRNQGFQHELSTSMSSLSSLSCDDSSASGDSTSERHFTNGVENRVGGVEGDVDVQRSQMNPSSSSFSGEFLPVQNTDKNCSVGPTKKVKKWWLSRLRSFSCVTENGEDSCECDSTFEERIQRVKVHQSGKHSKDLSALYSAQTIQAHKGAILTMKFSPDGKFLASGGEDRIVRVWRVMEVDRLAERDIPNMDPSSVYFTMNQLSELKPLSTEKEKNGGLKRNSDSACVILPHKVFRVSEKPVHEFVGHTSEILDLSWSTSNCLLSSSVDKTVRLWRVGHNHCLKVFPHNNYVTCVDFNPVDDDYFISGSIDGKVRVWEISLCKVVYWSEIKDIVTAVCYRPGGRGGIIGSRSGSCRFFSISDYQLQLHAEISLHNKKKTSGKRITGFQFFPRDPSKVMISCADSQFRIIQGVDVIGKYKAKGARSSGTFSSAHFTSDGKRIVSASEDTSVHIWKCADHDTRESSHVKKVKSSERFFSNASIALPWPGIKNETRGNKHQNGAFNSLTRHRPSFSPINFSCGQDLFQESNYPKGSALWPEEKLLNPKKTSSINKSEYKFLRTCQSKLDSHAWGMVIVTAGWDGRIRSFLNYGLPVPP